MAGLEKMRIIASLTPFFEQYSPPVFEYEVMFNPAKYGQKYKATYNDDQPPGSKGILPKFVDVQPQTYTFEFVIDGTGATGSKRDVNQDVKKFMRTTGFFGEIHSPLFLTLSWGTLIVRCIMESADVTYDLFDPEGRPLRARITASFKEIIPDLVRTLLEGKSSPDLTHVRTVQEGDTLPLMAQRIYGDASLYIQVAEANNLSNFKKLIVGSTLVFPPIDKLS